LVVLAVLVLAWLALGVRAVRLEADAQGVLDRARTESVSPAEVSRAMDFLDRARKLSPDRGPLVKQGQLQLAVGHPREAAALARRAVAEEPDNLQAWSLVFATARTTAVRRRTLTQLRRLNPSVDLALGLRDCLDCGVRPDRLKRLLGVPPGG
jgi:hypothetical protein